MGGVGARRPQRTAGGARAECGGGNLRNAPRQAARVQRTRRPHARRRRSSCRRSAPGGGGLRACECRSRVGSKSRHLRLWRCTSDGGGSGGGGRRCPFRRPAARRPGGGEGIAAGVQLGQWRHEGQVRLGRPRRSGEWQWLYRARLVPTRDRLRRQRPAPRSTQRRHTRLTTPPALPARGAPPAVQPPPRLTRAARQHHRQTPPCPAARLRTLRRPRRQAHHPPMADLSPGPPLSTFAAPVRHGRGCFPPRGRRVEAVQ